MAKRARQLRILEIIDQEAISTQAALVRRLAREGIEVNQSTVSRDIKELGLVKAPGTDGGYRYAPPDNVVPMMERNLRVLRDFVNEIDGSGSMAAVKTDPGNAQPVAEALDRLRLDTVVATLAGDNTLFVMLRDDTDWRRFGQELTEMIR